ncbi:phage tail protein [Sphingomonas montana]|uniref:phage tail protein n=1 Tax=Sphingomonas montana TaxID=1843236 RepID=UPI00096EE8B6|nr:phage tail protein [Sphingomonas montana]
MATLVLTTVGTLVGGPIGGAVGALIGNRIDGTVLGGGGRQGPRLGELSVQTSSYGSMIPKMFGRMRVAGTVIWATDLKENMTRGGGGKGQPDARQYSYSASFAVALSARAVRSIGRIWADGTLLRGAAGDWKGVTGFRFHPGGEGQVVDPLIAAVEGIDRAPAYRGIAYVVFEDMALAAYGNRIPSLSFEVEADAGPMTIGAVAAILSGGAIADGSMTQVLGYAASGDSVRGAVETLAAAVPSVLIDPDGGLVLREGREPPVTLPVTALGTAVGLQGGVRQERDRRTAGTAADAVTIAYYEIERDYQAGLQRAGRGGVGRRVTAVELPAVMSATVARDIAERRLATDWAGRHEAVVRLPWRWMGLMPGAAVRLPGAGPVADWRVAGVTIDRMVVEVRLVAQPAERGAMPPPAVPGRAVMQPDRPHGPTTIAIFELPAGVPGIAAGGGVHVAAAGVSPGWRSALLSGGVDGDATLTPIGRTAPAAVIGRVAVAMPVAGSTLFDARTAIEIVLLNDAMALEGRSDAAMLNGANLALVGGELIQFGRAEQIGVARFRLTRLLRGRYGTEAAIGAHGPDERFVLVEPDRLVTMALPATAIGAPATIMASGIGDADPVEAVGPFLGLALQPPAPVHLSATRLVDGTIWFRWTRRSRAGWAWADGVDVPLGEEAERYRLTISRAARTVRTVTVDGPAWLYPPDLQAADGLAGAGALAFAVAQLGTLAASREAGRIFTV